MENIDRSEKYNEINSVLNNYLSGIDGTPFYNNLNKFLLVAEEAGEIIYKKDPNLQGDPRVYKLLHPDFDELTKGLPYTETIQIVEEYLSERLPQYKGIFEEYLSNGIINMAIDLDDSTQDRENRAGYHFHHYVNIVIEHNYSDPGVLLHEFMHCLNNPGENLTPPSRKLLTEAISIFFESDLLLFMQEKGYNSKEIAKVLHSRLEECNYYCGSLPGKLLLLNTFKHIGALSDETYEIAEVLNLSRRGTRSGYLRDIDNLYKAIQSREEPPHISIGYMLGTIIAFSSLARNDNKMVDKFFLLNESVNSKSVPECLKIIGINLDDPNSIKEAFSYFGKSVEYVVNNLSNEDIHMNRGPNKL